MIQIWVSTGYPCGEPGIYFACLPSRQEKDPGSPRLKPCDRLRVIKGDLSCSAFRFVRSKLYLDKLQRRMWKAELPEANKGATTRLADDVCNVFPTASKLEMMALSYSTKRANRVPVEVGA